MYQEIRDRLIAHLYKTNSIYCLSTALRMRARRRRPIVACSANPFFFLDADARK